MKPPELPWGPLPEPQRARPPEPLQVNPPELPQANPPELPQVNPPELPQANPPELPQANPPELPQANPPEPPQVNPPEPPRANPPEPPRAPARRTYASARSRVDRTTRRLAGRQVARVARSRRPIPLRRHDRARRILAPGREVDSRGHRKDDGYRGDAAADQQFTFAEGTAFFFAHLVAPEVWPLPGELRDPCRLPR